MTAPVRPPATLKPATAPPEPARARVASRRLLGWAVVLGTGLTGWAYYRGYSPGTGMAGKALDFVVTWLLVTLGVALVMVVLRHGFHPARRAAGRGTRAGMAAGRTKARGWVARWTDPGPAQPAPGRAATGDSPDDDTDPHLGERLFPVRLPRPPARPRQAGKAPAHWQRAASLLAEMDPDKGDDFTGALRGEGTGLLAYASAVEVLKESMVEQHGMDAEALRVLDEAHEAITEAAAKLPQAAQYVETYYGLVREHAEEGKHMVHDGHWWEED